MKIGIIVAMEKEFVQLKTLLDEQHAEQHHGKHFVTGNLGNNEIVMQQCGIGKVNAAVGTVELINQYHPDLVISTGVAGGADIKMNVMDVVVSTECTYHDVYCGSEMEYGQLIGTPARFKTPKDLIEKALSVNGKVTSNTVVSGLIVTGDWFVDTQEKMLSILEHFPEAKAVDMESCSIAHTCHLYHTPFVSFRIISDIPLKDNKASQYFDFWARMAEGSFNVTKHFLESL
ncbi:MAG: 5'-methylthioadenosine/adenosylhomocysteine nucleosidase [Prevotella sp.]|nr:5'-methylthioadenosine/adenosylhomocysteine nucleosidase [Prevotella sp.]